MFLTALGFLLGLLGITALAIHQRGSMSDLYTLDGSISDLPTELYLEFVGALIAGMFWVRDYMHAYLSLKISVALQHTYTHVHTHARTHTRTHARTHTHTHAHAHAEKGS